MPLHTCNETNKYALSLLRPYHINLTLRLRFTVPFLWGSHTIKKKIFRVPAVHLNFEGHI